MNVTMIIVELLDWDGLWGLLACITTRKCANLRAHYHRARRAAIHCSAERSAAGLMLHVRVRPVFCDRTRPLASSTWTCWSTAASDMSSGLASSLTEAGPWESRSIMTRRPGSASAWNTRSSSAVWSSMHLSIAASPARVNVPATARPVTALDREHR